MKLWIDDVREMPVDFDFWAKNYRQAIYFLSSRNITFVSFDHDLGEEKTGYDIACWIEMVSQKEDGKFQYPKLDWEIHSANPVGRKRIEMAMKSAERFWKENENANTN